MVVTVVVVDTLLDKIISGGIGEEKLEWSLNSFVKEI